MTNEMQEHGRPVPEKIFTVLEREVQLSHELLDILDQEKKVVSRMDLPALIALSRKKDERLLNIQQLDETLRQMTGADKAGAGERKSVRSGGKPEITVINLSAMAKQCPPADAARLVQYRDRLGELREEILAKNSINRRFIKEVRGFLNDAISLITGALADDRGYGARGGVKPVNARPTLLSREV